MKSFFPDCDLVNFLSKYDLGNPKIKEKQDKREWARQRDGERRRRRKLYFLILISPRSHVESLLLQEGVPLPGPESGLLSNTWKWIVRGDTHADKARDFTGKGHPGGEQEGKGTQETCSATWLAVSGFMVMELVSRLSLASHSDSESFLVAHALLSQDGFQGGGFWVVGRTCGLESPFDLSQILLVGGGLLVPCSLLGPPVVKQLMQMVTWPGWVVLVSGSPNTSLHSMFYRSTNKGWTRSRRGELNRKIPSLGPS